MWNRLVGLGGVVLVSSTTTSAWAQDAPYECDDNYGQCGTPQQSGGGGGGGGGSILINNTDLGDTYQYADDYDDDGVEDPYDNCPWAANPDQVDDDGDAVGSGCDNCPATANGKQEDLDGDLFGDPCDDDIDGDAVLNRTDLCPANPDPLQVDTDGDRSGNACDADMDDDGVLNLADNCALVPNPDQSDDDPGAWGDACDEDDDGDGIRNTYDNCLSVANDTQDDDDGDAMGNACDADLDGDFRVNVTDNCLSTINSDQLDDDRDGIGEPCDDRFCYVVDGDFADCLDPTGVFAAYSPDLVGVTGERLRLRLFTNRVNEPVRYTWQIVSAPRGSNAVIAHSTGSASISTPFEYHYLDDRSVEFAPDVPGTYEVHVVAELVWEDPVTGLRGTRAEFTSRVEATGDAVHAGCATVPGGLVPLAGLLPGVASLLLARTRRR